MMDGIRDPEDVRMLIDLENELERAMSRLNPSFIVGRRGAGKTTMLRGATAGRVVAVELNSTAIFSSLSRLLSELRSADYPLFADEIADVWDAICTCALFAAAASPDCQLERESIPSVLAFGGTPPGPPTVHSSTQEAVDSHAIELATAFVGEVSRGIPGADTRGLSIGDLLGRTRHNDVAFAVAASELHAATREAGCVPVVNIDSLEDFTRGRQDGRVALDDPRLALALQGLFRHAGVNTRDYGSPYQVRACLPAELWHQMSDYSSNPVKDFQNSLILHWSGSELLHLAARRFIQYLSIEFPAVARRTTGRSAGKQSIQSTALLLTFLPNGIRNDLGTQEPTLSYILRHTLLLPRHVLDLLNGIFAMRDLSDPTEWPTEADVKNAIHSKEDEIVREIVNAHVGAHPRVREVCEALVSRLPLVFPMSSLRQQFHRTGLKKVSALANEPELTFEEARRILLEIGALGRVIEETSSYYRAEFEYHRTHKLIPTDDETMCWHPLFAEVFDSPSRNGRDSSTKPVYPLGVDELAGQRVRTVVMLGG
jgi:hypothetical protein